MNVVESLMVRRIGKYIAVGLLVPVVLLAGYVVIPSPFISWQSLGDYPPRPAIVVEELPQCKSNTIYVTESQRWYSDYEILDERCSSLQRKLVEAAEVGDVAKMQELVRAGANVNSPGWPASSGNGFVPAWSSAIWKNQTEAVRFLLDNGTDVNDSYSCCMTHRSMLMQAIQLRDINSAKLLIARGADLSFVGQFGWGVIDAAENSDDPEIRRLILSACNWDVSCRTRTRLRKIGRFVGLVKEPV